MKKPHSLFRRLLALALVLSLLVMPLPMRAQAEGADSQLVLESKSLSAFASGSKTDGEAEKINDTFTILWSAKSKVDTSAKTWEDGYASEQRSSSADGLQHIESADKQGLSLHSFRSAPKLRFDCRGRYGPRNPRPPSPFPMFSNGNLKTPQVSILNSPGRAAMAVNDRRYGRAQAGSGGRRPRSPAAAGFYFVYFPYTLYRKVTI